MDRIKQFLFYIFSLFYKIDEEFLKNYLDKEELYYFNKLLKSEKQHCIKVAKKCLKVYDKFGICDYEVSLVIKMCLLHDIGKIYSRLNLFLKPVIVIITNNRRIRKLIFFIDKKRICKYLKHSKYSYDILKKFRYSDDFLYSIRYHHSEKIMRNNKYINLLKYCDSNYC
ncbi:HD domain-containing protein [Candidatus Arthromitus sp. SFB-rat-Yit]|uniref:HD domain-containing protein n=1 Tax=Candidatus Arthromitus sp. SFB-rat-Yit TaxID=1041504 RepID=UPI000227A5BB|nr:HD domain-containing protein [Candidatus Arthromitus sp. SFB-rat-Yit]BAK80569.1 putative metal dependent phosphohydrolase [Candidatus Arthromitus sp. SFB-rat-Yit]